MDVKELLNNKTFYIERKKSAIKFTDGFGSGTTKLANIDKATNFEDTETEIKRTIVGNTYNWMDSHDDVHVKGCFVTSIKQKNGRIWHLHDHEHKIAAKVGKPFNIYEKDISWKELGVDKDGMTTALMMDTAIQNKLNPAIFDAYKANEIDQHSVGMSYVKIEIAANDPDYKEEFANWEQYLPTLANPERAEEKGYFFIVKEAKLFEISCVLEGSNVATPTLENIDPSKGSQKQDPSQGSQEEKKTSINYHKFI